MIKLTKRQQEVLDLIKRYIGETGFPPTRANIAAELGFRSPNAAEEHLKALARKGAIVMTPGASRGIRIPQEENPGLPIVGKVAAGNPIISADNIMDRCEIPANFFRPGADYLLQVQGDSMVDVGIMDGDLLAVHNTNTANEGEIIVARVDDEVTVKRLKHGEQKHEILLMAENPEYSPIEVDLREQQFSIEGISVGVIRRTH
ncbi:LexA repressor [BD1-7 clade bacterium]|uniref:LexA repressor n=1 Tax=BD1-7 clade bacterium TaxID=2029982 RepID=A0A5S9P1E0_9GAMM|nr:LexA repressor [BD1-7 clade bacterium]CAA0122462.1 LexA repressor [BD1-7 clade bacterium]